MLVDNYDVEIINVYKLCEPSFYIDERVNVSYLSTDLKPNKEEFKYALKNKRFIKIIKEGYKAFRIILKKRSLIRQCAKVNDADIIISSTLAFDKAFSKHQKNKFQRTQPCGRRNYTRQHLCRGCNAHNLPEGNRKVCRQHKTREPDTSRSALQNRTEKYLLPFAANALTIGAIPPAWNQSAPSFLSRFILPFPMA